MLEVDVTTPDGRTLHAYDAGATGDGRLPVFWHHGTPNIGAPPRPLFADAELLGIRWLGYDRPGYGGSSPNLDRKVASAAADVAAIADALGIDRFAVMGHSGGGPHALACAALLPERVVAAVSGAGLAPYGAEGLDWFAGMAPGGEASLRAAAEGRAAKERHAQSGEGGEPAFVQADLDALAGDWGWFIEVVRPAIAGGPGGLIDDDLAYVAAWGFEPAGIDTPVLIVHGGADRIVPSTHGEWVAGHCRNAELRLLPDDGHISVLRAAPAAMEWLTR